MITLVVTLSVLGAPKVVATEIAEEEIPWTISDNIRRVRREQWISYGSTMIVM